MTDKEYVIYACKTFKFTLLKPSKECKDILVMQDINGFMKCIAEGTTWKSIRTQLKDWQEARFLKGLSDEKVLHSCWLKATR